MKKNFLGKKRKVKLVMLVAMASIMGIQASQAYKIYCPDPKPPAPPFSHAPNWDNSKVEITAHTQGRPGESIKLLGFAPATIPPLDTASRFRMILTGEFDRLGRSLWCGYRFVDQQEFTLISEEAQYILRKCRMSAQGLKEGYIECPDK